MLTDTNTVTTLILPNLEHVFDMIEKNIFRPLPTLKKTNSMNEIGMEDDDVLQDPA